MYSRTLLIGRIGHNAEAKTDKNQQEFVVFSIATQDVWKTEQGEYDTRTEWHRVYAWRNLSRFAKTLKKGQVIGVDGTIRYREYTEDVNGTTVKHRVAEIPQRRLKTGVLIWDISAPLDPKRFPTGRPEEKERTETFMQEAVISTWLPECQDSKGTCRRGDVPSSC